MLLTVLAICSWCNQEVDAIIEDCDQCYIDYVEAGKDPKAYDEINCEHLRCPECEERIY